MPKLYVVATPIGNLGDLSPRAREVLQECNLIVSEDTRVTRKLLSYLNIHTPLVSNHRHNEEERAAPLVQKMLTEDLTVALVTDAGTPAISDPGSFLVREASDAGIEVLAIPGPSAMASALSVCGMDTREFAFFGFLPRKTGDLRKKLLSMAETGIPIAVVHESPHRIIDLIHTITETLPGCRISLSCDLTKVYEKTIRGTAEEILRQLCDNENAEKGEYCVVLDLHTVEFKKESRNTLSPELSILSAMMDGKNLQEAAEVLKKNGGRRNEVYRAKERVREFIQQIGKEEMT